MKGVTEITVTVADTFFKRLRGLWGRDVEALGGLLITPCKQIHTCFMAYPIDVVYLTDGDRVLRVDAAVPPWSFCQACPDALQVVELPANRAAELGISVGDIVYCHE